MHAPTQVPGVDRPAFPDPTGTVILIVGVVLTWLAASGKTESDLLVFCAWGTGVSLAASFLCDFRHGIRNMVRSDFLALLAIYGLCYAEFIMPDAEMRRVYDMGNEYEPTKRAVGLVSLAIVCFAAARHVTSKAPFTRSALFTTPVTPMLLVRLFWACFFLGYLHQWIAVKGDLFEWLEAMTRRRWAQPWSRTHFGSWKSLLVELQLLMYVVTPLGAIIIVRRKRYSGAVVLFVVLALALNLFHAFSTGTRHIFFVHVILFTTAFCYFKQFTLKMILIYGGTAMLVMYFSTNIMLSFRQVGLKRWMLEKNAGAVYQEEERSLYVDMTFQNLNRLVDRMPSTFNHLGWEVVYWAAVRPIPRAMFPAKPEGLSTTLEEILYEPGAAGTWSVTYVGEAFMAFGPLGVVLFSGAFGLGAGYWNRFGCPTNSDMGILIFASGFFQFSIAMRSMFEFMPAILPTMGLLFLMSWLLRNRIYLIPVTAEQRLANQAYSSETLPPEISTDLPIPSEAAAGPVPRSFPSFTGVPPGHETQPSGPPPSPPRES